MKLLIATLALLVALWYPPDPFECKKYVPCPMEEAGKPRLYLPVVAR